LAYVTQTGAYDRLREDFSVTREEFAQRFKR